MKEIVKRGHQEIPDTLATFEPTGLEEPNEWIQVPGETFCRRFGDLTEQEKGVLQESRRNNITVHRIYYAYRELPAESEKPPTVR